jgi:hypothetical protein
MRQLRRRWIYWLLAALGACGLGGSTLVWVLHGGDLAETISALSATLSALALIGVVVALYFQVQQTEIARVDALMTHRSELLMFAIEKPNLLVAWGFDPQPNAEVARLQAYASMVFNHMWAAFELNRLTPKELEYTCERIFKNEVITHWWGESRTIFHGYRSLPLGRRNFPGLVDEVYVRSPHHTRQVAGSPPVQPTAPGP